jgi:hypothetical protein
MSVILALDPDINPDMDLDLHLDLDLDLGTQSFEAKDS